jgi:hypothetical protein
MPVRLATRSLRWSAYTIVALVLLVPLFFMAAGFDEEGSEDLVVGGGGDAVALGEGGALGSTEPYVASGVTSTMQGVLNDVIPRFGRGFGVGCVGGRPGPSDHPSGRACDFMMASPGNTRPTAENREHGWQLARWLAANAARLGVTYIIWDHLIWDIGDPGAGWAPYTRYDDCTDRCVTLQHYDHVHVSVEN